MWWYKDSKRTAGAVKADTPPAQRPASVERRTDLATVVAQVLVEGAKDPDAILLMSLLVDSRVELADGTASDGMTWSDAERTIATALGGGDPLRLYNRFAKDFGDGYSSRKDVPPAHREVLGRLRAALTSAKGVRALAPRTRKAEAASK